MKNMGIWFLILGVGAFILPLMGMQFRLVSVFGDYAPLAAVGMIGVGGLMTAAGFFSKD